MKIYDATEQAYKKGYQDGHDDTLGLRPCLADDKPATFHRWVAEDKALLRIHAMTRPEDRLKFARHFFREEGVAGPEADADMTRTLFALVEYPDGSVGKVKPELIQFLDRKDGRV